MTRLALGLLISVAAAGLAHAADGPPKGKLYAQQLLDAAAARHHVDLALHVTPPKADGNRTIASTLATPGGKSSAADLAVLASGKPSVTVLAKAHKADVRLPQTDANRRTVGVLEVVLPYHAGDARPALEARAVAIRDEIGRRVSHVANLVEPARFDDVTPLDSYAQHLVDRELAAHPEVVIMAIHAAPAAGKDNVIIGSSIGRIGKKADEDDLEVVKTGVTRLEVNETGDRYEVEEVLKDVSGDTIGAVGVVFAYVKDQDTTTYQATAKTIQASLQRRVLHAANLFDPYPWDAHFSDATFAQALVEKTLKAHPELLVLAIHATPPGGKTNVIIGSSIGRIGKKADEDDLRVIEKGSTNLEANGKRFEAEVPLNDAQGHRIGALGTVYAYRPGDEKAAFNATGQKIRDEMAAQIPTSAALFAPAP